MRSKESASLRRPRSRKRRTTSNSSRVSRATAFGQLDLIQQSYPPCPTCSGAGKRLYSVEVRVISRGSDWIFMRENAKAFGTWDKLDTELRALIEKKCAKASWRERNRVYQPCARCRGSGRLLPEVETVIQRSEKLAALFYAARGWVSPKSL